MSTPSVVLTGYPPVLTWPGGTLLGRGYPTWVPPGRVPPILSWPGGTLPGYTPGQGTPLGRVSPLAGYPPAGYPLPAGPGRVPPLGVCPMEFWVMLQSIMGYGYPPSQVWTDKVKLLPSHHTTYTGGNYKFIIFVNSQNFPSVGGKFPV